MVSSVPIFSVLFILPPHEMKRSVQPQAPMPPSPFIRNGGYKCISLEKCSLSSPHEMKRFVQPQAPMPPSPFIRNGGYKCISFEKCSLSSPFAFCQYCFC